MCRRIARLTCVQSRKNCERTYVFRTDNGEMPSIQRRDHIETESFGKRHYGCVDGPKRQIVITSDKFCNPYPITRKNGRRSKVSG